MIFDEKGGGLELNVDEKATGKNIAVLPPMVKSEEKLTPEMHANARLIAAAPDLLAALEAVLEYEDDRINGPWPQAVAAIAKARG